MTREVLGNGIIRTAIPVTTIVLVTPVNLVTCATPVMPATPVIPAIHATLGTCGTVTMIGGDAVTVAVAGPGEDRGRLIRAMPLPVVEKMVHLGKEAEEAVMVHESAHGIDRAAMIAYVAMICGSCET